MDIIIEMQMDNVRGFAEMRGGHDGITEKLDRLTERQDRLTESQERLTESQAHTDRRLDALIDIVRPEH